MNKTAVIIPCFKVKKHILHVIKEIPKEVSRIYVVDDCCSENTGNYVETNINDDRVTVVRHEMNLGVGGATITGYMAAINDGMKIIVKIDGDGQMNPSFIPLFVQAISSGGADYVKGNRFWDLEHIKAMPKIRILGNSLLSFFTKLSSGYWDVFDPTNGFTAIHANVVKKLPIHKISKRYFFESDMLFRLNLLRAVVVEIPMEAIYDDETSNMKISKIIPEFLQKHTINLCKRIFYNYFLRNISIASFEIIIGTLMVTFGVVFGVYEWLNAIVNTNLSSAGTVMLAALPVIVGVQLLLNFIAFDVNSVPKKPIHNSLLYTD